MGLLKFITIIIKTISLALLSQENARTNLYLEQQHVLALVRFLARSILLFFNLIVSSSQCHICMEPSRLFRKAADWCCDLDLARCSGALKPLFVHTPCFITHYCCHNFSWAPSDAQSRTLLVDKTTGKFTSRLTVRVLLMTFYFVLLDSRLVIAHF